MQLSLLPPEDDSSQPPPSPNANAAFKSYLINAYCAGSAHPEYVASAFEIISELRSA